MRITELGCEDNGVEECGGGEIVWIRARTKRALVGAGARILFYPTLLYNVCRNKIQAEFRWWDQVDQVVFRPNFIYHFLLIYLFIIFFFSSLGNIRWKKGETLIIMAMIRSLLFSLCIMS